MYGFLAKLAGLLSVSNLLLWFKSRLKYHRLTQSIFEPFIGCGQFFTTHFGKTPTDGGKFLLQKSDLTDYLQNTD